MNVYDFDGTIYSGDSTLDFWFFCLKKEPGLLMCFPEQFLAAIRYKLGMINKTYFKEEFFCFLKKLDDTNVYVKLFWDINEKKIASWYKNNQKDDDVVISASPCFLLEEICRRIGIRNLIVSRVDPETGRFIGLNCYGEEKVRRFSERLSVDDIDEFYTDSYSDAPLAAMARTAYLVKKGKIKVWDV